MHANNLEAHEATSHQDLFVDVKSLLERLMTEKRITANELAARLSLPATAVDGMLRGSDMTLRQLAAVFSALGESAFIGRKYTFQDN